MCGIIGYIGKDEAAPIMLEGLRKLEYRGYDSAGIAVLSNGRIETRRSVGRIQHLADLVNQSLPVGSMGISHTRWATHGGVTENNAHPHRDGSGKLALVHNGVIENYQQLKDAMIEAGHVFSSETDTEVLAHLVGYEYDQLHELDGKARLITALREALKQVNGTYGIALIHADVPDLIVGARRGSPLVLGIGKTENFLASDVGAIVSRTRDAIYLDDYDIVALTADGFEISALAGDEVRREVSRVEFTEEDVSRGKYPHYMLKEIFEQPESIRNALRGRLSRQEGTAKLGGLNMTAGELRAVERIILVGCGTALHAARVGETVIESLAHIPVEVEFASEFRYGNVPTGRDTLVIVLSQSGETADTLAALRESKRKGLRTLGICNNVASTIARESDGGVYMHAGPEIGVAATKSFTSQVMVLVLLGLLLGRMRHLSHSEGLDLIDAIEELPEKISHILKSTDHIREVAGKYAESTGMMFLGRQANYAIALEGALKMKEITYMHAEGHPSAELKHGVIALISPELPTVCVAPHDAVFEKNLSNIEEVKARMGPVIAVGTEGCKELIRAVDDFIGIPECHELLTPILSVIPLQLLAYHAAVALERDVDKPRNLAKSVTVE